MPFRARYVPVAKQRAKARRDMGKLKQEGKRIQPVEIEGRAIARSFWGKGWCHHLESFSDYANRLPRGRRYARNGSVCHLEIRPGHVEALVSGSQVYEVTIEIAQLQAAAWKSIKAKCAGQVGSMLELLQGRLSREVMGVVTERNHGLFPKPREIHLGCSCPDWATMCKHVAAALYGVGHRLDHQPDLLFLLRDVDASELIASEIALPGSGVTSGVLADEALSDIFGIDLDSEDDASTVPKVRTKKAAKSRQSTRPKCKSSPKQLNVPAGSRPQQVTTKGPGGRAAKKPANPSRHARLSVTSIATTRGTSKSSRFRFTGASIARLRRKRNLSVAEFARQLGVSPSTVYRWELTSGNLNLQNRVREALQALAQGRFADGPDGPVKPRTQSRK